MGSLPSKFTDLKTYVNSKIVNYQYYFPNLIHYSWKTAVDIFLKGAIWNDWNHDCHGLGLLTFCLFGCWCNLSRGAWDFDFWTRLSIKQNLINITIFLGGYRIIKKNSWTYHVSVSYNKKYNYIVNNTWVGYQFFGTLSLVLYLLKVKYLSEKYQDKLQLL